MFNYLKPYVYQNIQEKVHTKNSFYPISEKEIEDYERFYDYEIPSQLKIFYKEIGYGFLTHPHEYNLEYKFYGSNRINSPALIKEMLEQGQTSGIISEVAHELLQPGDLPFFEMYDSSAFLKMQALSDNPNAIWTLNPYDPIKIADSLEEFIKNLYYKDPGYYGDVIEAHYAQVKH